MSLLDVDMNKVKVTSGVGDQSQSHKHIRFALVMPEPRKSSEDEVASVAATPSSASSLIEDSSGTKRSAPEKGATVPGSYIETKAVVKDETEKGCGSTASGEILVDGMSRINIRTNIFANSL